MPEKIGKNAYFFCLCKKLSPKCGRQPGLCSADLSWVNSSSGTHRPGTTLAFAHHFLLNLPLPSFINFPSRLSLPLLCSGGTHTGRPWKIQQLCKITLWEAKGDSWILCQGILKGGWFWLQKIIPILVSSVRRLKEQGKICAHLGF